MKRKVISLTKIQNTLFKYQKILNTYLFALTPEVVFVFVSNEIL